MMATPGDIPQTVPVADPIVATAGLLILQTPPPTASVSFTHVPEHKEVGPIISPGEIGVPITFTVVVVKQPVDNVYLIVSMPMVIPAVTIPDDDPTVAMLVFTLLQVPPAVTSDKVVVAGEKHSFLNPVIEAGTGLTVIVV